MFYKFFCDIFMKLLVVTLSINECWSLMSVCILNLQFTGNLVEALHAVLKNPPINTKNQNVKVGLVYLLHLINLFVNFVAQGFPTPALDSHSLAAMIRIPCQKQLESLQHAINFRT